MSLSSELHNVPKELLFSLVFPFIFIACGRRKKKLDLETTTQWLLVSMDLIRRVYFGITLSLLELESHIMCNDFFV